MSISGNSVKVLTGILKAAGAAKKVRFVVAIEKMAAEDLERIGFDSSPEIGDFLIPAAVGVRTEFNARGREIIRKDLPKQPESIMFYGASTDWHGNIHRSVRTRTMDKYPREMEAAPSEILQIIEIDSKRYISSSELNLGDADGTRNLLVANIMLECFTLFDIVDVEKQALIGPTLKRLQWDILPGGEYPWKQSKNLMHKVLERIPEADREVIEHRMEMISRKKPDFLATGRGGFNGYFVYGFSKQSVYVLESIYLDNATYVFYGDWEPLAQLTKGEIINSNLPHRRVIHNDGWYRSLSVAIEKK